MGATLSAAQIAGVIKQGAPMFIVNDGPAVKLIAIALAESGGVVDARGGPNSDGSYDWGLWQINDKAHPDLMDDAVKTQANANWIAAFNVSHGGTYLGAWSTYNSGSYEQFMDQAKAGWGNPSVGASVNEGVGNVAKNVGAVLPKALTDPATWVRVGMAIAGVILLALVLASIVGPEAMRLNPITNALSATMYHTKRALAGKGETP